MTPTLVATAGPMKGATISLAEGEVSIGRDRGNDLHLDNIAVSRRHCVIRRRKDRFLLEDLDSSNGTFVNEVPVRERWLEHGDQIRVGDSQFLFALPTAAPLTPPRPVELKEDGVLPERTVELPLEEGPYPEPKRPSQARLSSERLVNDLRALVAISTAINSLRDVETLAQRLLEAIFEVIPAERGAVLLLPRDGGAPVPVAARDNLSAPGLSVEVSRTIVTRVLEKGVAVLANEVQDSEDFSGSVSLVAALVRSVLAVPLVALEKRLGVVYLDSRDPDVRFDEGHLRLLTALAGIAGTAFENVRHMEMLGSENQRLMEDIRLEHNMVGESPPMRRIHELLAKVAPADATVLVSGESGTGKELVARAIHRNSPRRDGPFVAINCAALAETLLESEMFGHERGAFTGAIAQKKGKLEVASGGTVFLDEIGELAPTLQAKLLRFLQEREFERVGGTRPLTVDVRVIAATNKDLQEAVRAGSFREDLYYRVNVVSVDVPPLRERRDDIPLLAGYFASKHGARCKRRIAGFSSEARRYLMDYAWPGNVRELENAIERAVVLGSGDLVLPEDLPDAVLETAPAAGTPPAGYHEAILETKRQLILRSFEQARGSHAEAARLLGVHPNYLHRLIRNMDLRAILKG